MLRALAVCAFAIIAGPAIAGDAQQALQLLQSCAQTLGDEVRGVGEMEKTCPGLRAALGDLRLEGRLYADWEKTFDRGALEDVVALEKRYAGSPSTTVRKESLKQALDQLKSDKPLDRTSWWERAKAWLRGLLSPDSEDTPQWLKRLLENFSVSDSWLRGLVYALVILVVGLAVGVIVVELRAARVLNKRAGGGAAGIDFAAANRDSRRLTLADVDAASWRDRPTLLLRLTVQRLVELNRLQSERSLTHRELARRAQFGKSADRERFERLAALAEKMRFGAPAEHEDIGDPSRGVLLDGRGLLTDLQAEPRA